MIKMPQSKLVYLIINFVVVSFLLGETQFTGAPAKVSGLTDAQRAEIESLRNELNDAFEKHDEEAAAEQGVVVQPSWTQNSKDGTDKVNTKVEVTKEGLDEVKLLRAEINKAVTEDTHIAGENSKNVKQLELELNEKQRGKAALDNVLGITLTTKQQQDNEEVGAATDDSNKDTKIANVVDAISAVEPDIDIRKLQRLEVSKRRTKEMLILKWIEEDFSFNLGDDVKEWEHILHGGKEYFIGRRDIDLFIVHKDAAANYEPGIVVTVGQPISYLATYSHWNAEHQQQEGVILVATHDKVLWYRGDTEKGKLTLYWQWVVGSIISSLTHFTVESHDYLAISSNESSRAGFFTLSIYQFDLHAKEFWIAQRLQLQNPCNKITILDTGRDIILAVAQSNSAAIYTFNPHLAPTHHMHFQLLRSIESQAIESVSGFQMGGRSYLALGGLQPKILLYEQGNFIPKTILGNNFGLVELFFPIPTRTYRDDLILLVQHRVDFATHAIIVLETLIWDGAAFEASIPVPCKLGEHTVYGVSCMLDIQREAGLKGATLLRRGDEISVIVPRHNAESGLFRLHTELLAKNSELIDLQEILSFMQDWVKEQDDLVAQAQEFVQMPEGGTTQTKPDLSQLEILKTPELELRSGDIGEIYINAHKWSDQDSSLPINLIVSAIEKLGDDLPSDRQKRGLAEHEIGYELLDLDKLLVEHMIVNNVNNQPFYIQEGALNFDGILNLQSLLVLEEVKTRKKLQTVEQNLAVEGNMEFESINDIPWREIRDNLLLRNQPLQLTQLQVEGQVVVETNLSVSELNSQKFPNDFLWSSGPALSVISAEKIFTGTLKANVLDTDGVINGMNAKHAITLNDPQDWPGLVTFTNLEVSNKLELNGTAQGRDLEEFQSNPTLTEANIITAACNFQLLDIRGPLILNGDFGDKRLMPLLADVVKRSEDPVTEMTITAPKTFSVIALPIDFHIELGKVNNISIEEFITLDSEQELAMTALPGYIYFNNLTIKGLYDGVDIEELLVNSIKIHEPQFSPETQLNFIHNIKAHYINVNDTLNGVPIGEGFQTVHEDLNIPVVHFENLHAEISNIRNNIVGNAALNDLLLHEFLTAPAWHEPHSMGNLFLNELILQQELETDELHGTEADFVFNFFDQIDDLPDMILNGQIKVDHVIVTGEALVSNLNGKKFDEDIQMTVVWLNRVNYLNNVFEFVQPLEMLNDLVVLGDYNGRNLPELIDDMIFRSANATALILAPKNFVQAVNVLGDTTVKTINSLKFNEIANKHTINNFAGSLRIIGNVVVSELELAGYFNDYPMSALNRHVHYDRQLKAFVLLGEHTLPNYESLQDLTVLGNLNNFTNLSEFLNNLVYKDKTCILKGENTFSGRVTIEKGAYVRSLNGYNLLALLNNMVFIHDLETVTIKAPLVFQEAVKANGLIVRDSLSVNNLSGCVLEEWLRETLRVDRQQNISRYLRFAPWSLDGSSLYASFLNDLDLSKVITLHSAQNLTSNLLFSEIYLDGQMHCKGLINNVDLQAEYENTLLTYGDQHVSTPLTMQSVAVLNNLQTNALINNDKDLQQVIMLDRSFRLESPLFFHNISAKNVKTNNLISGIDMDHWFRQSLWLSEQPQQYITGNWTVRSLTVQKEAMLPTYMMNGVSALQYETYKRLTRASNAEDFDELCTMYKAALKKQQNRSYILKHLEQSFELRLALDTHTSTHDVIKKVFALKNSLENFLLINSGCYAYVFKWSAKAKLYEKFSEFKSGPIDQIVVLPAEHKGSRNATLQFITNYESTEPLNCSISGLNTWTVHASNITHAQTLDEQVSAIHSMPSQVYGLKAQSVHEILPYNTNNFSKSWNLPEINNETRYRFVPTNEPNTKLMLTNGRHILLLGKTPTARSKRAANSNHATVSIPFYNLRFAKRLDTPALESILKPNASLAHKLTFADFKQIIERILSNLVCRLNLEVNITQLSIPESDLYDEHLVEDFLSIIQELRKQQIYPADTFADIKLEALQIPHNPAQVLAARTVQIIWPVIVEIEEVHNYLCDNETHEHPVCACLTASLGLTVHDVLLLANGNSSDKVHDAFKALTMTIERIREFQHELEQFIDKLNTDIARDLQIDKDKDVKDFEVALPDNQDVILATARSAMNDTSSIKKDTFSVIQNIHLPPDNAGEFLSLQVSSVAEPRHLLAVTTPKTHVVAGQQDGIKLYLDTEQGNLFQTIAAHQPRSLASLRIHDESLLAYIEDCCIVNVLIYRGVQGFVEFTTFKTKTAVSHLLSLNLPAATTALADTPDTTSYFLAAVLEKKIIFYELVVAGLQDLPQACK